METNGDFKIGKELGLFPLCALLLTASQTARAEDATSGAPPSSSREFSLGTGAVSPLLRPYGALAFSLPVGPGALGGRIAASYLSLKSSFQEAAAESQYSAKLNSQSASLTDVNFTLPELTLRPWGVFFCSVGPEIRASLINVAYLTPASESLQFNVRGVAAGVGASGGYRFSLSTKVFLDVAAEFHSLLWSFGWSSVDYGRDNSLSVPTFSEADLEQMLDSLQPYLQRLSKQSTFGAGLRLGYTL